MVSSILSTEMAAKVLQDGLTIPILGLGMWRANSNGSVKDMVLSAIKCGYRLFDTATMYGNEEDLGKALRLSKMKREEYFVVSKLSEEGHGYTEAKRELNESLKRLKLDFIDLYLIHSPTGGRLVETWKALVELKEEQKVRSIGVSNFNIHHLEGLASVALPLPSTNQIEIHPWLQQRDVVDYCNDKGIALMAFCPLGRCKQFQTCPLLDELSVKYGKTKAQIVIRWSIQKDYICIPKSSQVERQQENIDVFNFSLSKEEMDRLDELECDMRVSNHTIKRPWEV